MAKKRPACGRFIEVEKTTVGADGYACQYERMSGRQMCIWHWLLRQSPSTQQNAAYTRSTQTPDEARRPRVPKAEWPEGERWCAGCQSFVPLFYTTGSRCKACASAAAHEQRVEKVYGISGEEYAALLELQNGVCYICQRAPKTKRLAVDHDHDTGEVRGLLCPDNERGCNMAVLGGLSTAKDGALAAARRAVEYLEDPPYDRLRRRREGALEESRQREMVGPGEQIGTIMGIPVEQHDSEAAARAAQQGAGARVEPPRSDMPDWMG